MVDMCDEVGCSCYGKPYVDRGYGYPVCQSVSHNQHPIQMDVRYRGRYDKEEPTNAA